MKKTILLATISYSKDKPSGSQKLLMSMLQGISREKYNLILAQQQEDMVSMHARKLGIAVLIMRYSRSLNRYDHTILRDKAYGRLRTLFGIIACNLQMIRALRGVRIDAVWCSGARVLLTILPFAKLKRIPLVWNIWLGSSRGKHRLLNSIALRAADIVTTEYEAQKYSVFSSRELKRHAGKIIQVFTATDPSGFRAKTAYRMRVRRIINAGIVHPRKNQMLLLRAAKQLMDSGFAFELLIVGDSIETSAESARYRAALRAYVQENRLQGAVKFLGWREDVPELLRSSDIFVHCSLNEGLAAVIREAMLTGLPVIASDVGGAAEVVINGRTGILLKQNSLRELASAIKQLVQNPALAERLGRAGRKHISQFTVQSWMKSLENALDRAMK